MIIRIKDFSVLPDFFLKVEFDDGKCVLYDVNEDIEAIESYSDLKTIHKLFEHAKLDSSRTCIYWNKDIDLPSDQIYEYGKMIAE